MVVYIVFEGDYGSNSRSILDVCTSEALAQRVLESHCVGTENGFNLGENGELTIESYVVRTTWEVTT